MDTQQQLDTTVSFGESFDSFCDTLDGIPHKPVTQDPTPTAEETPQKTVEPVKTTDTEELTEDTVSEFETQSSAEEDILDYKQLYQKTKKEHEAHVGLLNSRIQDLSAQYQETKRALLSQPQSREDVKEFTDEMPASVKEIFEIHPDIAAAMKDYVDMSMKKVSTVVDNKVAPMQHTVQQIEAKRHRAMIEYAHPDVEDILVSGDLQVWINELTPAAKAGALYVYNSGSAEEIVSLLDTYKVSRRMSKPSTKAASTSSKKETKEQNDAIVNRVMDAMSVPTTKEQINTITTTKPAKSKEETFRDEFEKATLEFEKMMRR